MYRYHYDWYALLPQTARAEPPLEVERKRPTGFKYKSHLAIAMGGIYDGGEVERTREQIMVPGERTAISNMLARTLAERNPDMQGWPLNSIIDETAI